MYVRGHQATYLRSSQQSTCNDGSIVERHLDTSNLLYVDGHVKSLKMSQLTTVGTSGAYKFFTMRAD